MPIDLINKFMITYKLEAHCYLYKKFTLSCVSFRCMNYNDVELIEEHIMKIQKLYTTMKPYALISLLVIGMSSIGVNAMGYKHGEYNTEMSQEKSEVNKKHHAKRKKSLHRLAKKLDLTSEQRDEIKAIYAGMKEGRKANKESLSSYKEQLKSLMAVSQFDENEFNAIYAEFQASFQQVAMEKAKHRHAIMQVLTPEQQAKFLTMRKHR